MKETFETIYSSWDSLFSGNAIDLSQAETFDPWTIGLVCLRAIEIKGEPDKKIILPKSAEALAYLKRVHFDQFMRSLAFDGDMQPLMALPDSEGHSPDMFEIVWSTFRDEFSARLVSRVRRMFQSFGMNDDEEQRATALVGELGNNVYDHNEGSWPTDVGGALIIAQHYPEHKRIEVVVADPGVGFLGSLKQAKPDLADDIEAIQLGLQGVTGRVGEKRGNGLKLIQRWTIEDFQGILRIHSGSGLVEVDQTGTKATLGPKILGTLAELVVFYK